MIKQRDAGALVSPNDRKKRERKREREREKKREIERERKSTNNEK